MVLKKRLLALALVGAMVCGSSITALAEDINGATGAGATTGHLDTDVVQEVLPTSSVDGKFAFTIDPENILASADFFTDGTTAVGSTFKNDDLVYFPQATSGAYASSSQAVNIAAKNYIAADVSVNAKLGAAPTGKTLIPMAASEEERAAATEATLLLTVKVGTKTGAIVPGENGVTVTDTIAAQNAKFDTKWDADASEYKVVPKSDATFTGLDVQLIGKMKGGTVASTVVAPTVTLTWTVAKHNDAPTASATSIADNGSVDITLPTGITISEIQKTKADGTYNTLPTEFYTLTDITGGKKLTLKDVKATYAAATKIKVVFSTGDPIILDVTE